MRVQTRRMGLQTEAGCLRLRGLGGQEEQAGALRRVMFLSHGYKKSGLSTDYSQVSSDPGRADLVA